ncbi:YiiX/YebB-like N1pC/P60 family cysteine hydrolase [Haloferula chungangensis]|uniref:YiiX/YebB-like N1pC/P60 family cysteine hydrolase n=1 Tax=Haloferula chungangensis TaxID=1048331 RepID=A0ABW2L2Q2_9BACT
MLRLLPLFVAVIGLLPLSASAGSRLKKPAPVHYDLREGDIVFQGNAGPQSDAVRAATGSPFTHCGIVFKKDGQFLVMEAIQPVQVTPLERFIQRSLPGTFHAMRLKQAVDPASLISARNWAAKQAGLPYDVHFRWDDEKLYCSEFVWKAYEKAGVKLCEKRPFRSYELEAPAVKQVIDQRYGGLDKLPLDEPAVAPGDLAASPLLVEVPRLTKKN